MHNGCRPPLIIGFVPVCFAVLFVFAGGRVCPFEFCAACAFGMANITRVLERHNLGGVVRQRPARTLGSITLPHERPLRSTASAPYQPGENQSRHVEVVLCTCSCALTV